MADASPELDDALDDTPNEVPGAELPELDPVEALAREEKWFLGSGDGIIFAPPFPVWLDAPGYWDEATVYEYGFAPLYTVTLLDEAGRELPLRVESRRWTPAELTVEYTAPRGVRATETRSVHPGGVFASEWRVGTTQPRSLHLVAWTAQETTGLDLSSVAWNGALAFVRALTDRRGVAFPVRAELAALGDPVSWSATLSERSALQPHWRFAPFAELWEQDALPRRVRLEGVRRDGLMYGAVHLALPAAARESTATFGMRLSPAERSVRHGRGRRDVVRPTPAGVAAVAAAAGSRAPTPEVPQAAGAPASLGAASRRRWQELFRRAPRFRCSDPYLERYYWYRWYGLWLNGILPGVGNYEAPTFCEGVQFFHQPITYSGQCHVRELRWLDDPEYARGVLRTFFRHQKPDGSLHGRVYVNHLEGTDFYHANWGDALLALDAVWPDDAFVREMYPLLARHADWLADTRDADGSGMIDVVDQYETGQEYMSRYQAVDPQADAYGWENRIRLKGIDVTVYAYALVRALAELAERAGAAGDVARWRDRAEVMSRAVRERMWSGEDGMFFDVDPRTGAPTQVRAAVCFYPYFTDLARDEHLDGLERNLLDPERFWTPYPVPSSALDDPLFDARAEWKGKRHVCPWNGRVWPMTNSHIAESLGRWATPERPGLRRALADLVTKFVHMMYHDGDLARPNCYEHYNPFTGAPSVYRGIDDYQHSWVADLLLRFVAGVRPHASGVVVDPFPFGLERVELNGVHVRGRELSVSVRGDRFELTVDGERHASALGEPVALTF